MILKIYLMHMNVLPSYMYVHHVSAQRSKEGLGSTGTGTASGCEPPCGCWELNVVLCKSNECSEPLSYVSSLLYWLLMKK